MHGQRGGKINRSVYRVDIDMESGNNLNIRVSNIYFEIAYNLGTMEQDTTHHINCLATQ